jgi:hypothetical protein
MVAECETDHSVPPSTVFRGGRAAALRILDVFLKDRLQRYAREKNEPSAHATSGLSPYLHYRHIAALEVALACASTPMRTNSWSRSSLRIRSCGGSWLTTSPATRSRLDTLEALPDWARATIAAHRQDAREAIYTRRLTCEARFTATTGSIGGRKSSSGQRRQRTISPPCATCTIVMLSTATIPTLTRTSFGVSDCMTAMARKARFWDDSIHGTVRHGTKDRCKGVYSRNPVRRAHR